MAILFSITLVRFRILMIGKLLLEHINSSHSTNIFRKTTNILNWLPGIKRINYSTGAVIYHGLRIKWKLQCFFINYLQLHTNSSAHISALFTSFAPFTWIWSQCDVGLVHCGNFIICRFSVVLLVCRLHHQIGIKFNENGSTKMLSGNVKTFSCIITNFLSKECRQIKCGSSEIFGISYKRLVDTFALRVRFVYDVMMAEQSDYINIWALFARNQR